MEKKLPSMKNILLVVLIFDIFCLNLTDLFLHSKETQANDKTRNYRPFAQP